MRDNFLKLIKQMRKRFSEDDLNIVRKAYARASVAHHGQKRLSGEAYVIHSIWVARILADSGMDPITCAAGLLHDVIEDTPITKQQLAAEFGNEIASLVDAVTKISKRHFEGETEEVTDFARAQNIRKILVATAQDVRVILIKLADRLHNMRTLWYLPREKQIRISRETKEIYAPLAHRLGISRWKWELEDHAFHYLRPEEYKRIAKLVAMTRRDRESQLRLAVSQLEQRLRESNIDCEVIARPKHLYSIYEKMSRQGKDFNEVMDVQGVRVITKTKDHCYDVLGAVHDLWPPMPGRLKDYIAMPKLNMYRAIHTTVMRENGRPMEVQIRSAEMDLVASEGIAAHWRYKGHGIGKPDGALEDQIGWLRQMYEWLKDTAAAPEDWISEVKRDLDEKHLYVYTPRGEIKELPNGATPLDFAYLVHSEVGNRCTGARVNGRIVPLRYHLQAGDIVEILTSKNQHPHLDWLNVVVTGRARTRIRQKLRELGILEPVEDEDQEEAAAPVHAAPPPPTPVAVAPPPVHDVPLVDEATRLRLIRIEGFKGMAVHFAKCCEPMPGQPIVGYATKTLSITVHRVGCKSFAKSARDQSRVIEASWEGEGVFETTVRVVTGPRPNVLADLTNALRPMNLDIIWAKYMPVDESTSHFDFLFEDPDDKRIGLVVRALRNVTGVREVNTLGQQERAAHRTLKAV